MIEISVNNIKKTFGFNNILNELTFEIHTGDRVSIIGDNGCGKSTLLNILCGVEKQDAGVVSIKKNSSIGYLIQQPEKIYGDEVVKDILYKSNNNILELSKKIKKYEIMMQKNSSDINLINKYLSVQEEYINIGGYEIDTLIEKVSHGLKINNYINCKFSELSGGEQKRVLLGSLIIKKTNILILDEPTNHLDIETLEWLENYLNKYKGTIIVVSHDRFFLDKVTNKTILLENGKNIIFNGNYSFYLNENELRIERELKEYKNQQKLIEELKKKIKQLQEFGKLAYPGGDPFFRRAENIRKRLERIELKERPIEKKDLPIKFEFDSRSGKDVLSFKKYDLFINDRLLIKSINFSIYYGDKVCLMGSNGCGKTTLIDKILENNSSSIKIGSNIKIGYIPQQIRFKDNITVLDYSRSFFIGEESHLRSALDKFYFHGECVFKKVNNLSGGETVRLKLFELMNNKSNFIILDEPTNYLDIYTKEILENTLKDFSGTVLFISHDRFFINKLATKVLYIDNKYIKEYNGNYDYFVGHLNK